MASGPLGSVVRELRRLAERHRDELMTDTQLLERFIGQHDEIAFEILVQRHGPLVLRVCRQLLSNVYDAEDAFQATFLILVRKARRLREPDRLGNWLYGVAYRVAVRARTQNARRRSRLSLRAEHPIDRAGGPKDVADQGEVIHEEVSRLPDKYRTPVVLCYLQGKTHEQAAEQLRWPVGTVKGRLSRARELLRGRLSRRGCALSLGVLALEELAIPRPLLASTVEAAARFAVGDPVASTSAVALAEGVMHTMSYGKWILVAVALTAGVAGVGTGRFLLPTYAAGPAAPRAETASALPPPATSAVLAEVPEGWGGGSAQPGEYELGLDSGVAHGGKASGTIKCVAGTPTGFGSLTQAFKADDYRGKRVRYSGYIKTRDASEGAGLWMRVDSTTQTLTFDNMDRRKVKDTDWKKAEIVLDVPADAAYITFGVLMNGTGQTWVDDLKFEVVGNDVASTNMLEGPIPAKVGHLTVPDKPVNLDFEGKK
jgi:RNA polymerase sigma factor (sigma-70 family)